jgi:hypothetical protein
MHFHFHREAERRYGEIIFMGKKENIKEGLKGTI